MRIAANPTDDGDDAAACPHCKAWLLDLADDVDDSDEVEVGKCVASRKCPACGKLIAVVRHSTFDLAAFK